MRVDEIQSKIYQSDKIDTFSQITDLTAFPKNHKEPPGFGDSFPLKQVW